jgi:hypothetical protein
MQRSTSYSDDWKATPVKCDGGLVLNSDMLTQANKLPGSALVLQNFEVAVEGGYKRILGHAKYDSTTVPGDANTPILGAKVGLNGAFACRYSTSAVSNDIYFSSGSGWTKVNSAARPGSVLKMRGVYSNIIAPAVIFCDGVNYAGKWDGTTWTTLNSAGAPANPKFAAIIANRLVLAGYGSSKEITISEPNTDIAFTGGGGAATIPIADEIVGIKTFRNNLFIYCRNSIKQLTGTTLSTFAIVDVTAGIGCISGDSIQEVGGDIIFLAPDGLRSTAASGRTNDIELGLVSDTIQPSMRTQLAKNTSDYLYSSCVIRGKSQYRLYINDADTAENAQLGYIGKLQPRQDPLGGLDYDWSTIRGVKPYCADSAYNGSKELAVIGDRTSGYVYQLESGNSFNGSNISAIYRTPDLFFDSDTLRKVMQKISIYCETSGVTSINFKMLLDFENGSIPQPDAVVLSINASGAVYGSAIYDTSKYGTPTQTVFKTNLVGSGTFIAFEFSSNDSNPPYIINDFTPIYSLKSFR